MTNCKPAWKNEKNSPQIYRKYKDKQNEILEVKNTITEIKTTRDKEGY